MVWDCVSALGKGNLHFYDGGSHAGKILVQHLLPSGASMDFATDNPSIHFPYPSNPTLGRRLAGAYPS